MRAIPKVGGTKSVNLEKIRALEPTHVILNKDENLRETAEALAAFVPNLVVTHPLAPEDNLPLYRQFGAAFGKEREAEALCVRFEAALKAAKNRKYPQRRVLYLIWKDPWMTVSRDTYISRTLGVFGMTHGARPCGQVPGTARARRDRSGPGARLDGTVSLRRSAPRRNQAARRQSRHCSSTGR